MQAAVVRATVDRKTGQRLREEIVEFVEVDENEFYKPLVEIYGKRILEALQSQPEGLEESGEKIKETERVVTEKGQQRLASA